MASSVRQTAAKTHRKKPLSTQKQGRRYEDEHFIDAQKPVWNYSLFTDEDIVNFKNGTLYNGFRKRE